MCELIKSIQKRDPASPTYLEVALAYNGYHAIIWHRMNNFLWRMGFRALPRVLSNIARFFTSIEIHPEATIGQRVFIDHGTGVVIGQTAIIGDDVTLYHGVTLGGVGRTSDTCTKRHPTIENGAMIGAGAQVLGNITIGKGAKIGSNSVVTNDIPDGATALGIPARVIGGDDRARGYGMPSRAEMSDVTFTIDCIIKEMSKIKQELNMEQADCAQKTTGKKTGKKAPQKPSKKTASKPKKAAPKKASKAPTKKT